MSLPLLFPAPTRARRLCPQGLFLAAFLALPAAHSFLQAQELPTSALRLSSPFFKEGDATLQAFEPISKSVRHSVVKLDLDGSTVALATVIDPGGLVITKASELRPGKLTCWLANGKEVEAELVRADDDTDLALVKVKATGLKPIQWASEKVVVGQWVMTPGVSELPQAIGIVSVPPRKIYPKRALIGVALDFRSSGAEIGSVMKGLGAEKAGLKAGDRIVAVNAKPVKEGADLMRLLREYHDGQSVTVRVRREEKEFEASIKMMAAPERTGRGLNREERMNRMGSETSERAEGFAQVIQHDTVLQAWQCGGPLVNLDGKALGINIARPGRVASYALPAELARRAITKLRTPAQVK